VYNIKLLEEYSQSKIPDGGDVGDGDGGDGDSGGGDN